MISAGSTGGAKRPGLLMSSSAAGPLWSASSSATVPDATAWSWTSVLSPPQAVAMLAKAPINPRNLSRMGCTTTYGTGGIHEMSPRRRCAEWRLSLNGTPSWWSCSSRWTASNPRVAVWCRRGDGGCRQDGSCGSVPDGHTGRSSSEPPGFRRGTTPHSLHRTRGRFRPPVEPSEDLEVTRLPE